MSDKIKITDFKHLHEVEVRKYTNLLLERIEEGLIDPKTVVLMCLKWMSEEEVSKMCQDNELFWVFDREDDDPEEDTLIEED